MNINLGFGKYAYKLIVVIMACILSERIMAKAAKFLKDSEQEKEAELSNNNKAEKQNKDP